MVIEKPKIHGLLSFISILLLFLLMLTAFSVYVLPYFGWRVDTLSSGSMEPQLRAGELVVIHSVAPQDIAVGDIIAFYATDAHENLVSHRVIGIEENPLLSFQTKGDANEAPDPLDVPARNLVGRIYFHAPLLGYAVFSLKTIPGLIVALVIPGFIVIGACLYSLRYELAKKKWNIVAQ